jgi:hypothetical protein
MFAGHVAVFYINKLRVAGIQKKPLNEHFEQIFEVGVDEVRKGSDGGGARAPPPVCHPAARPPSALILLATPPSSPV